MMWPPWRTSWATPIHSMLASDHSLFTFHSSLPLAETASTFGEMMLVDRLLREETR